MSIINNYINSLNKDVIREGVINTIMCKKARLGLKMNKRDYLDPAKANLKQCSQMKQSNPAKAKACQVYYKKMIATTERAMERGRKDVSKYCKGD